MKIVSRERALAFSNYYYYTLLDTLKSLNLDDKSVLDLACGSGEITDYILRTHPNIKHIEGQDINESKINFAKKNFPHIKYDCLDGNLLDWKNYQHIDTVFLLGVKTPIFFWDTRFLVFFYDFLKNPKNTLYLNPVINDVSTEYSLGTIQSSVFFFSFLETSEFNFDIELVNPQSSLMKIKNLYLSPKELEYVKNEIKDHPKFF